KFHTCADPVGGIGPGEVRMRTDTRPLTRLGRGGRPSHRRFAMRIAPALTPAITAVGTTLARTRRSHGASGRASAGAAGARRGRVPGEHVRDGTQTTSNIMTVRLIFVFLVVGCAAALPHGRLEPRPIELYPTRGTS